MTYSSLPWLHHLVCLSWEGPVCGLHGIQPPLRILSLPAAYGAPRALFLELVAQLEGSQMLGPEVHTLSIPFSPFIHYHF